MNTFRTHRSRLLSAVFFVFFAVTGWSENDRGGTGNSLAAQLASNNPGANPEVTGGYRVVQVGNGAALRGVVRYSGSPPPRTRIPVDHDHDTCARHDILSEDLIVSSEKVKNAVVWLKDVRAGKAWPDGEVTLDQEGCVYRPHVVAVGVGGPIRFVNSDPVIHNINTFPIKNLPLNVSLLAKGMGRPVVRKLKLPDEIKVTCDAHKWMSAWIVVRDNPYFAVTGDDGSYVIEGIPAGAYTMAVWHESLARVEKAVQLTGGKAHVEDVEMRPR